MLQRRWGKEHEHRPGLRTQPWEAVKMAYQSLKNCIYMFLILSILLFALNGFAQVVVPTVRESSTVEPTKKKPKFIAVPIPIFSDVIGNGLAGTAAVLYQADPGSKTSVVGLGGFYSNSASWGIGAGVSHNFKGNKYKAVLGAAYTNLNLDFYGIGVDAGNRGVSVLLNQKGGGGFARFEAEVAKNFYLGLSFRYISLSTSLKDSEWKLSQVVDPKKIALGADNYGPGLAIIFDSRDNNFNPQSGLLVNLDATFPIQQYAFNDKGLAYQKYMFEANYYMPLAKNMVLAYQVSAGLATASAPFYDICSVDLRGYQGGKYRDDTLLSTQIEYRWRFYKKFGLVVFGGVAGVAPEFKDYTWNDALPAGGIGFRWLAAEAYNVNIAVDYGWGKGAGNQVLYISFGEAF
jgi:hypothetical protein